MLVLVVLIPVSFLVYLYASDWLALRYVSSRLGTNVEEWSEIYEVFEARFKPGMSRHEVLAILTEIDPTLEDDLRSDTELRNSVLCRTVSDGERCTERVI